MRELGTAQSTRAGARAQMCKGLSLRGCMQPSPHGRSVRLCVGQGPALVSSGVLVNVPVLCG